MLASPLSRSPETLMSQPFRMLRRVAAANRRRITSGAIEDTDLSTRLS